MARSPLAVRGVIRAPGDKSISHRSLIFAAMASGPTRIRDILASADVHATAGALRAMGADIPALSDDFVVNGRGVASLHSPVSPLDCGNSGTTTRLIAGLVAGLAGRAARFEGDASLSRRPMRRIAAPLTQMGARIDFEGATGHDGLPMRVHGMPLSAITFVNTHASAQVKGALMLAGLASGSGVTVQEPQRSRDHTERMLIARGVQLTVSDDGVLLPPAQTLNAVDVVVPSDPSSATFFVALAALADEGEIRLENVCLNPTRTGAFDVLRRMGVRIDVEDERTIGGEVIGTLVVFPASLQATSIGGAEIPRCIDELPMIACVAARAVGETRITDAGELRVKESDRIRAVVENLRRLGVDAEELPDGMRIIGSNASLSGHVVTHGDHRLAMAFGILGALPGNRITIDDPGCVSVSYPAFWRDLAQAVGPATQSSANAPAIANGPKPLVIAIDGPAASGKSSTAQWVAQLLNVHHVDSGAFYRAITLLALGTGVAPELWTSQAVLAEAHRITWRLTERSVLPLVDGAEHDEAMRDAPVTRQVSRVAQMAAVRHWVNDQVRAAGAATDVVVDGRDIGTAVFPTAALKVFLVADPWERARRRLIQRLGRRPNDAEIAEETEALVARDALDAAQSAPARDAITIDTTTVTQEEQVERIVALAKATRDRIRGH
ncbi:3-phosphoshikimate 1-carboxyvinyltransferase [Gemmatimonas groenlandica]|uniref:Multifunctional fusion protein n=1 Tax=Gemmatimonas groenlandica TaxID=2732249 RepID=A0A6M4IIK7_9BACT|nr:3-phosphoshikimate 1-carboxyvinyltransferase [Gemmatimonas groenlandica]QJR34934.1 3-phosphoshikimate 1-carboxyvinyltransferase [Gemmatimonas groenlandica]